MYLLLLLLPLVVCICCQITNTPVNYTILGFCHVFVTRKVIPLLTMPFLYFVMIQIHLRKTLWSKFLNNLTVSKISREIFSDYQIYHAQLYNI